MPQASQSVSQPSRDDPRRPQACADGSEANCGAQQRRNPKNVENSSARAPLSEIIEPFSFFIFFRVSEFLQCLDGQSDTLDLGGACMIWLCTRKCQFLMKIIFLRSRADMEARNRSPTVGRAHDSSTRASDWAISYSCGPSGCRGSALTSSLHFLRRARTPSQGKSNGCPAPDSSWSLFM